MQRHPGSQEQAHIARGRRVIQLEAAGLKAVMARLDGDFAAAVQAMLEVVQSGRKIIVTGVGKSGHIGAKIAATLSSTGAPAVVLDAVNASHGDLGMVAPRRPRHHPQLQRRDGGNLAPPAQPEAAGHARSSRSRAIPKSTLARPRPTCTSTCMFRGRPARSTSRRPPAPPRCSPWATRWPWCCSRRAVLRKEDFALFHPGGTLGRNLLLKVQDVMRPVEQMVILPGHRHGQRGARPAGEEALRRGGRGRSPKASWPASTRTAISPAVTGRM